MQHGLGEIRRRNGYLSNCNLDPARASSSLRFDPRLAALSQDQQAPVGPGILHRDSQELLDQLVKDHLPRNRLRGLDYSLDVQPPYQRANGGSERGGCRLHMQLLRAQQWVLRFELPYLPRGAPTVIAIPCTAEIGVGDCL
jgi:hypothetical protein